MRNVNVVIGANFGDEGKGLITDYLSSMYRNGLVVRFNGGAQAGHTVVTPSGTRHVFSHFGAGTCCGLPVYLSKSFIVNPLLFVREYEMLLNQGFVPQIYVDKECLITTPYDMVMNQYTETNRGNSRHGSCGLGIHETIARSKFVRCTLADILDTGVSAILKVRDYYGNDARVITSCSENVLDVINDDDILKHYLDDISFLLQHISLVDSSLPGNYNDLIFEGAQGLLLDQNCKYFPHVTHSNTGLKNVADMLQHYTRKIDVTYVVRNYLTRHGAGPLPNELEKKPYPGVIDDTNIYNEFQGCLRFGLLDIDSLKTRIRTDLACANDIKCNIGIAVTCMDQVDDQVKYVHNSENCSESPEAFLSTVIKALNVERAFAAYGPSRDKVRIIR